jgi:hypothetical protein
MKRGCTEPNTANRQGPDGSGSLTIILEVLVNTSFKRAMGIERRLDGGTNIHFIKGPVINLTTWDYGRGFLKEGVKTYGKSPALTFHLTKTFHTFLQDQ